MKMMAYFLFREHGMSLLLCLAFSLLGIAFGEIWSIVSFVFILFFFYEWNVSPKSQKTWDFFESLPLTFRSKYIIRVLIPFLISSVLIFFLRWSHNEYDSSFNEVILESLKISSIFLLSSILSSSLAYFFILNIIIYIASLFLSSFHYYSFSFVFFVLFVSAYILSQKRISSLKFYVLPSLASVLMIVFGATLRIPLYTFLLQHSFPMVQREMASVLIQEEAFIKGKQFFYMTSTADESTFTWENYRFDDDLVYKIENVVLQGSDCSELCSRMASKLQKTPNEWNLERLSSYLNSESVAKQTYALIVLQGSSQTMFFNRIVQLVRSSNPRVSSLAAFLLKTWGINSLFDLPATPEF
jgi:hypothetical protein